MPEPIILRNRRKTDPRLERLVERLEHTHDCVETLKRMADQNERVLADMRDILASFRVVGATAKWIAGIATAAAAVWGAVHLGGGK